MQHHLELMMTETVTLKMKANNFEQKATNLEQKANTFEQEAKHQKEAAKTTRDQLQHLSRKFDALASCVAIRKPID